MKYVFIEKYQAEFSIKAMCRVLRVARSGKPAPSGAEGKSLPEVQPGQLPFTQPACVRKSAGAGFLRQWT